MDQAMDMSLCTIDGVRARVEGNLRRSSKISGRKPGKVVDSKNSKNDSATTAYRVVGEYALASRQPAAPSRQSFQSGSACNVFLKVCILFAFVAPSTDTTTPIVSNQSR